MPNTSRDPVDHSRTTRQHAGETMKAGVNAPGLIGVALGILALVVGLFSFANGSRTTGVIAIAAAVVIAGAGFAWLALRHRKVQRQQVDWHRDNPDAHYEPPTS